MGRNTKPAAAPTSTRLRVDLALISNHITFIGPPVAYGGQPVAFVGPPVAFVSLSVALIGLPVALVGLIGTLFVAGIAVVLALVRPLLPVIQRRSTPVRMSVA